MVVFDIDGKTRINPHQKKIVSLDVIQTLALTSQQI